MEIEETPINNIPLTAEQKKEISENKKKLPEILKAEAIEARRQAYVLISDPVYMQYARGVKTKEEWLAAVAEVEAAYPIPGEETA